MMSAPSVPMMTPEMLQQQIADEQAREVDEARAKQEQHEHVAQAAREAEQAREAELKSQKATLIGVPVISYLAGAGIGRLGLIDGDRLEPSNLHRQTMYALADVGKLKADLAAERFPKFADALHHSAIGPGRRRDHGNPPLEELGQSMFRPTFLGAGQRMAADEVNAFG